MNICRECQVGEHGHVKPGHCCIKAVVEFRSMAGVVERPVRCECQEAPDADARKRSPLADTQVEVTR